MEFITFNTLYEMAFNYFSDKIKNRKYSHQHNLQLLKTKVIKITNDRPLLKANHGYG